MQKRIRPAARLALAALAAFLFPACALIPRTVVERGTPDAYSLIVILGQREAQIMDFYERHGLYYGKTLLATYDAGTPEILASPKGSFVMLYDRSRPGYPFHFPETFGWLSLPELEAGYYGVRTRDRIVLLIVADSPGELTDLLRSMPRELLEP
jgi:hypothetical protein